MPMAIPLRTLRCPKTGRPLRRRHCLPLRPNLSQWQRLCLGPSLALRLPLRYRIRMQLLVPRFPPSPPRRPNTSIYSRYSRHSRNL